MAWQLHYTSARRGPTGRAGFQFVAETPGLPDGARAGVMPHLSYRPPPEAPPSPDDSELERFPVTLLYDVVDGRPLLLRCRYLGRDYSGRYGNFFAHAVVAEPAELEGMRPAELWRSPLWAPLPADGAVLDELDDLAPGTGLAPDDLAAWLPHSGPEDPFGALGLLVSAVRENAVPGGRVVLVADDVELIARWIALVSYSLPVSATARLSFVTYSADPLRAGQILVGTTPDVWAAMGARPLHETAVDLRTGRPLAGGPAAGSLSRFARGVGACWRDSDFAGLDFLGEVAARADAPAADCGDAAALLALCRADAPLTGEEEAELAAVVSGRGIEPPDWLWRELRQAMPFMGLELALAVHENAPHDGAGDGAGDAGGVLAARASAALAEVTDLAALARVVRAALRAGLAVSPGDVADAAARCTGYGGASLHAALTVCQGGGLRGALLDGITAELTERTAPLSDPDVCDALFQDAEWLRGVPHIAVPVLASVGGRIPGRRAEATGRLLNLDGRVAADVEAALAQVWASPPSAAEGLGLLEEHGTAPAGAGGGHPALGALLSRVFTRLAFPGGEGLADPETLRLADRIREVMPEGRAGCDAALVQAYGKAITAGPARAARALEEIAAGGAGSQLAGEAFVGAARRLCGRPPAFRADLLAALPAPVRARLGERWTAQLPGRARAGRVPLRGGELEQRNDLIEVVLRLKARGAADPALEAWARAAAGRWLAAKQLDSRLARSPRLRAALRDLLEPARGDGEPPRGGR
ncbi:hypothetical protein E1281_09995 [Actinomadura sp. KC345]|uniref:GAP1-N2 domain-containing protein n=1 Tax=Actinomadura sp. KC345 TaxID=2530371 RepID=UPI00104EBD9F|nr:hypothetical protein [Actinomadura sp. KC345]TDC55905.1 hypothetical protein E1281_09995 [Actinomadura sp. KC345]